MNNVGAFLIFWCSLVALFGIVHFAWGIHDLRRGSSRMGWYRDRVKRDEEPFEFWVAVGSKLLAAPVAVFMIWLALSSFSQSG